MSVYRRGNGGNDAVQINGDLVNGPAAAETINYQGSDWYWTVCACMTFATIAFIGLSTRKARSDRIFHYITAGITMVAAIAYYTMASNLGWVAIRTEFSHSPYNGPTREIFYVRYIDWFITTPLLLMDLLLTAGLPWPTVLWVILVDWVMVVTGLVGALVSSSYKWGYYTFGCVALFYIIWVLGFEARRSANALGKDVGRVFLYTGSLTALLWLLYPIAWGVCEGGNVISTDGEAGFYGALDLFAKPVFGALLIWGHKDIDPARLGLRIRDYTANDASVRGGEKHAGANGTHNTDNTVTGNTVTSNTATNTHVANNTAETTV